MESISGNFRKGISKEFDGQIWKLLIHEGSDLLAVETRDSKLRKVLFSVINTREERLNFHNRLLEQSWNLNLFHLTGEYVLLKSYKHAESPEIQGLICLQASTGEIIWGKYNISPDLATEKGIRVFDTKLFPRKYFWIDYSGNTMVQQNDQLSNPSLLFPHEISSCEISGIVLFKNLNGPVLSLTHGDYHIYSFHEKLDNLLRQRIVVTQGDSILLDDIIIEDIQNLQPEAFFIQNHILYYVRNKREIISYFL